MKKAIYFPVHTTHYSSVKSLNIRMNYDFAGYALYLMLWQKLAESTDRTISIDEVPALAFDFRCDKTLLSNIINQAFEFNGDYFYSQELNDNLTWYDDKHNKSSEGGKKAASKMSKEQLIERASKASNSRWKKDENSNNANTMLSTKDDMLSTKQEMLTPLASDANNINRNINIKEIEKKENKKETKKEEEKNKNLNKIENLSSPEVNIETYNLISLNDEVLTYINSNFFDNDNLDRVCNEYIQYKKTYTNSKINLNQYEGLLYFFISMQNNNTKELVNKYLKTITITPSHIQDVINIIHKNEKVKDLYQIIISSFKTN